MVYMASTVACATTLCVVNIGATEARVECLLSSFLQLREDRGACMEDEVCRETTEYMLRPHKSHRMSQSDLTRHGINPRWPLAPIHV